ncbi:MAG TPA: sigma-54 dependent transcriptional regulator [Anaeromyxobacter sp.]|nr:sigma-54 dependent transcriptional regulator [Anaeromyxobacter sp.]
MAPERILVVDGDIRAGRAMRANLCERGYDAVAAAGAEDALALVPSFGPGALLLDATLPEAASFAARLEELGSDAAVVVVAPPERLEAAVLALRGGAESFILRPVEPVQAHLALERALERRHLRRECAALRQRLRARAELVGSSPAMQALRALVLKVGPTRAPVLLTGAPGTGKAHLAQALHEASPRRDRAFVRASCAGLSELLLEAELFGCERGALPDADERRRGRIEEADGGTLYLQEVGRLSPALQLRLLAVIQSGSLERVGGGAPVPVDVRVVASSQRDLAELVQAGTFREELYYRLAVVSAALPPVRARRDDLPALVAHLVAEANLLHGKDVRGLAPGALSAIFSYAWPGNVRELSEALGRAVAAARGLEIALADLPPLVRGARAEAEEAPFPVPGSTMEEIEREAILRALDRCGGSTSRAAELLGVSVRKVQYRLKEYRVGTRARRAQASLDS